jgi:YHS domain-containing protein
MKKESISMKRIVLFIALVALVAPAALAAPYSDTKHYTLGVCAVEGVPLGDNPVVKEIEGRQVKFCCEGCAGKYEADPATHGAKLDEKIVEQQMDDYPMTTCVVAGGELGSMGDPVEYVHENRLVRFCCAGCKGKFEADPKTYIEQIDAATVEKQGADYPTSACVVMPEEEVSSEPYDMVIANRLLRLCCKSCMKDVMKDPAKWLGELDKAEEAGKDGDAAAK